MIPNFIYKAMRGEPLPFTGDDNASRDFTCAEDIQRDAEFPPGMSAAVPGNVTT